MEFIILSAIVVELFDFVMVPTGHSHILGYVLWRFICSKWS
jgi:hypothetical protein